MGNKAVMEEVPAVESFHKDVKEEAVVVNDKEADSGDESSENEEEKMEEDKNLVEEISGAAQTSPEIGCVDQTEEPRQAVGEGNQSTPLSQSEDCGPAAPMETHVDNQLDEEETKVEPDMTEIVSQTKDEAEDASVEQTNNEIECNYSGTEKDTIETENEEDEEKKVELNNVEMHAEEQIKVKEDIQSGYIQETIENENIKEEEEREVIKESEKIDDLGISDRVEAEVVQDLSDVINASEERNSEESKEEMKVEETEQVLHTEEKIEETEPVSETKDIIEENCQVSDTEAKLQNGEAEMEELIPNEQPGQNGLDIDIEKKEEEEECME